MNKTDLEIIREATSSINNLAEVWCDAFEELTEVNKTDLDEMLINLLALKDNYISYLNEKVIIFRDADGEEERRIVFNEEEILEIKEVDPQAEVYTIKFCLENGIGIPS